MKTLCQFSQNCRHVCWRHCTCISNYGSRERVKPESHTFEWWERWVYWVFCDVFCLVYFLHIIDQITLFCIYISLSLGNVVYQSVSGHGTVVCEITVTITCHVLTQCIKIKLPHHLWLTKFQWNVLNLEGTAPVLYWNLEFSVGQRRN